MRRRQQGMRGWTLLALMTLSCDGTSRAPAVTPPANLPQFNGMETEAWLTQTTEPTDRDDVLPAFKESARSYGCVTDEIGSESSSNIHGEMRRYYGVSATCREGTIALITLVGGRVSIGCAKPTTREACDSLLRNIAEAR